MFGGVFKKQLKECLKEYSRGIWRDVPGHFGKMYGGARGTFERGCLAFAA